MSNTMENIESEIVDIEIDIKKTYLLPIEIKIVKYKTYYLVIYTEGVMWIVLRNDEELAVFNELNSKKNIEYVFKKYSEESVMNVIIQIEAKKFEHPSRFEESEKNVYIYLTNNCNQRCKHCYMFAGDIKIEELEYKRWIKVLTELKKAGCEGVTFTGGEITVYKGFDKLIKYAHEEGLRVTVLSNGILWTQNLIDDLHEYIDEIQISIDGYDSESYYAVRRYDGFDKAMTCIKNFYNIGTKVSMAVTPLYDKLDAFILNFEIFALRFLNEFPEVFIKLNHELIVGREVEITEEKNKEYKKKLKALVEKLYPEYYIESFVINYQNKSIRYNCGFGGISIAANGDVYWCNRIHELKSTINVFDMDMEEIIRRGNEIKNSTSVDNTTICKNCEVKYICGGGCRMKYENIKDIDNHEGEWTYVCEGKEYLFEKMVLSNEYFFEK